MGLRGIKHVSVGILNVFMVLLEDSDDVADTIAWIIREGKATTH